MSPVFTTNSKLRFSKKEYEELCRRIYKLGGINLAGKVELVEARLSKRVSTMNLKNYEQYFQFVDDDRSGKEQIWMIDALTTNKTSFYREIQHFDFMSRHILPNFDGRQMRIWSAACSTGEEPYSIAVQVREELPKIETRDVKILATDISTKVLKLAHDVARNCDRRSAFENQRSGKKPVKKIRPGDCLPAADF